MKIQLISFSGEMNPNYQVARVIEIINSSKADLILFPGHALRDGSDRKFVADALTNEKVTAIIEIARDGIMNNTPNSLFIYRDGEIEDMYSSQVFTRAEQVNGNTVLMEKLLDEIPRRQFKCDEKRVTVLQCGESAIISGKGDGEFRFKDNAKLNKRFEKMMDETEIFLNPIHTFQGHQNQISKRRAALSSGGRYYLSTASTNKPDQSLRLKSLQYICHDGKELFIKPDIHNEEGYVSRIIEIP